MIIQWKRNILVTLAVFYSKISVEQKKEAKKCEIFDRI